jgi:hypothetical protein
MRASILLVLFACVALSTAQFCVNTPGSCLRLRGNPSLSGAIITCAPHGARLTSDGQQRVADGMNWRRVNSNGNWGWAAAQFLQNCGASPPPPAGGGGGAIGDLNRFPTSYATSGYTFTGRRAQVLHFLRERFTASATTYSSHSNGPLGSADLWTAGARWAVDNRNMPQMNALADFIAANLRALSTTYVIWRQRIYHVNNPQWRQMENRGSITQNHFDHVHITFA